MKTVIVAVVASVLFAAIATQLYSTLFESSTLALLALVFVSSAGAALVTVRFGARQHPPSVSEDTRGRARGSESRDRQDRPDKRDAQDKRTPVRHRRPAPPKNAKRENGTVKWFDRNKGFGFIVRENGDEIFVHHRSIRRVGNERTSLDDGQDVSFVAVERQRGWQAEDVAGE